MPLWHCPHCGTPQVETARCWVCRKSSTSCATCRHFRRGVAAQLGFCGLDRHRDPLGGEEIRGCWDPSTPTALGLGARTAQAHVTLRPTLAWREVSDTAGAPGDGPDAEAAIATTAIARVSGAAPVASAAATTSPADQGGPRPTPAARPGAGFWADADL